MMPLAVPDYMRDRHREHLEMVLRANTADWHRESEPANYRANIYSVPQTVGFAGLQADIKAKGGRVLLIGRGKSLDVYADKIRKLSRWFVVVVADTAVQAVYDQLAQQDADNVYVVSSDSDPKGHLTKYFDQFAFEKFPANWRLIASPVSNPRVVARFHERIFHTVANRPDVQWIKQSWKDYPFLPKVQVGSSCLTSALPICAGLGAHVVAALGVDFLLRVPDELDAAKKDELQKKCIVRIKGPDNSHAYSLTMLLRQRDEFAEMLGTFRYIHARAGFKFYAVNLGMGLFPGEKMDTAEVIRRIKHGELQH